MRIGIDGITMSQPQPGGYQTYTRGLVQHLARMQTSHEFALFVDRPVLLNLPANWRVVVLSPALRGVGIAWREQVMLPQAAAALGLDLLHCPANTGPVVCSTPTVVTMHDTIEFTEPLPNLRESKRWAMRIYCRTVQQAMSAKAVHVITVSAYSRQRLLERFGLPAGKVTVVNNAVDDAIAPLDKTQVHREVQARYGVARYVLAIASLSPRKNTWRLVSAYATLPQETRQLHPLLLVCTQPAAERQLLQQCVALGCADTVHLVVRPSDQELTQLYNAAVLFVFPSLEEGFGLPPLEAMACDTPVLASNLSAMPEVLGDAALYFDAEDTEHIKIALKQALGSESLRAVLVSRGLARRKEFSWERAAAETLAVYAAASER